MRRTPHHTTHPKQHNYRTKRRLSSKGVNAYSLEARVPPKMYTNIFLALLLIFVWCGSGVASERRGPTLDLVRRLFGWLSRGKSRDDMHLTVEQAKIISLESDLRELSQGYDLLRDQIAREKKLGYQQKTKLMRLHREHEGLKRRYSDDIDTLQTQFEAEKESIQLSLAKQFEVEISKEKQFLRDEMQKTLSNERSEMAQLKAEEREKNEAEVYFLPVIQYLTLPPVIHYTSAPTDIH